MNFISQHFEEEMGHDTYKEMTEKFEKVILPQTHPVHRRIRRIVDRIV